MEYLASSDKLTVLVLALEVLDTLHRAIVFTCKGKGHVINTRLLTVLEQFEVGGSEHMVWYHNGK